MTAAGNTSVPSILVCVKFVPPVAIEPSGVISFTTCPVSDVTVGWF